MDDDVDHVVTVRTDRDIGGVGYVITVEYGPDQALGLTTSSAQGYVELVYAAIARAEYDASVIRQMREKLHADNDAVAVVVKGLRARRTKLSPCGPVSLTPGVSRRTMEPYLILRYNRDPVGQWTPGEARHHASGVLDAIAVAPLDNVYREVLTDDVGTDAALAAAIIDDLSHFRDEY